jgi:hypothetical protein
VTTLPAKTTELCQDIVATRLAGLLAEREGIPPTAAIRKLMMTETYALLLDPLSYLYLESVEYVLDMYDAELAGDMERWLEV